MTLALRGLAILAVVFAAAPGWTATKKLPDSATRTCTDVDGEFERGLCSFRKFVVDEERRGRLWSIGLDGVSVAGVTPADCGRIARGFVTVAVNGFPPVPGNDASGIKELCNRRKNVLQFPETDR